ncbi:MAG: hypothetical protein H0T79_14360 [Deltaproteobacteria bacterium]|nr:hypothetical protein [Deltaproteobacteria bacterium]
MGYLVTCESIDLRLPKASFLDALAALHELAGELEDEFFDPDGVLEAEDLIDALEAAQWSPACDEAGDLVTLTYAADKPPRYSRDSWPEAMLTALAPWIVRGSFRMTMDTGYACDLRIAGERVTRHRSPDAVRE